MYMYGSYAGWPDEFVKKIAQNVAKPVFLQNYKSYFVEKSSPIV
jgi:hypothetical protein